MKPARGGMQLHGVPDDERALDNQGRPLPWGYYYADSTMNRKTPVEKGPFGKVSNRRSMSRSKTATPATKEDILQQSNQRYEDEVFSRFFSSQEQVEKSTSQPQTADTVLQNTRTPVQPSAPVANIGTEGSATSQDVIAQPTQRNTTTAYAEPVEVLIYGYGLDHQPAAISFYENSSRGRVYEDYERQSVAPRYASVSSTIRSPIPKTLPMEFRARINQYRGGDHWIKVTFDSSEAAELACHVSPHVINGFIVHAEPWHGSGPPSDAAIVANRSTRKSAGLDDSFGPQAQEFHLDSVPEHVPTTLPQAKSSAGREDSFSPNESSTATATKNTSRTLVENASQNTGDGLRQRPGAGIHDEGAERPLRVIGARRIQLQPASAALMPLPPWTQRMFGHLPFIGSLFGGQTHQSQVIGGELPRDEKGEFDWGKASLWWRACWCLDNWLGTDLCGLKGDD